MQNSKMKQTASTICWQQVLVGLFSFLMLSLGDDHSWGYQRVIYHHNLIVNIDPEQHSLMATATIQVNAQTSRPQMMQFSLNKNLVIDAISLNEKPISFEDGDTRTLETERDDHLYSIQLPDSIGLSTAISLSITYHGMITDQPRATPGLRFIKPDSTTGYIGPEGVYLTSELPWYPKIAETLGTFRVHTTVPLGWETVTQGKEVNHLVSKDGVTSEWESWVPSEELTLVANRFVKKERLWNDIAISTYLLFEHASLADQYLNATADYLDMYTALLGPYPFRKFSVVENFFPSGLGLPSFTLLGSRSIKRGYTQSYSLGHEIVHSWFGNWVLNDYSTGNWIEGLTTYLANYYYEEVHELKEIALNKRKQMFFEYNLYGTNQDEYPVIRFHHKEEHIDNAIGYQKVAMIFHMLRQEVGETAFFSGIRQLLRKYHERYAGWREIEKIFNQESGRNLNWFFEQWVNRGGTPTLAISHTNLQADPHNSSQYFIHITLKQLTPHYRLRLPVEVYLVNGKTYHTTIVLNQAKQILTIAVPSQPMRLAIDPAMHVLRRLDRDQIPPMLNVWVTDRLKAVFLDWTNLQSTRAYTAVLQRLRSQTSDVIYRAGSLEYILGTSSLMLGNVRSRTDQQKGLIGCGDSIKLDDTQISVKGEKFEGPEIAWILSCPDPENPQHVMTMFDGFSPSAISKVARLFFFYGWDSYLIFNNGEVVARGLFEPISSNLEVVLQ